MNIIEYILNNTEDFIWRKEGGLYYSHDWKYRITESDGRDLSDDIDREARINFEGSKVIITDARVRRYELEKSIRKEIEILDRNAANEIKENIEQFRKGKNMPAVGTGQFKMRVILEIKKRIMEE